MGIFMSLFSMTVKSGTLRRVWEGFVYIVVYLDTKSNSLYYFFLLAIFSGQLLFVRV